MLVKRTDNAKSSVTLKLFNKQFSELKIKLAKKYNTCKKHLSNHGIHLNQPKNVKLVINFISYVNKI